MPNPAIYKHINKKLILWPAVHMWVSFFLKKQPQGAYSECTQFSAIHTTYIYIYSAVLHSTEVGRYF